MLKIFRIIATYSICITAFQYCRSNSSSNDPIAEIATSVDGTDTLFMADTMVTVTDTNGTNRKRIPINEFYVKQLDSSKLIKAFDNISFGLPEKMPIYKESGYSINGNPFEFVSPDYFEGFGLYAFALHGTKTSDYEHLNQVLNEIIQIINIKYGPPRKINGFINDELGDLFRGGKSDDGDRHFKYSWLKNKIEITLGYKIGFRYEYVKELAHSASGGMIEVDTKEVKKAVKTFFPIVVFEYRKISDLVNRKNRERESTDKKEESNKL